MTDAQLYNRILFPSKVYFLSYSHWDNFNFVFLSDLVHSVLTQ